MTNLSTGLAPGAGGQTGDFATDIWEDMMARRFQFTVDHMIGRREVELVVTYSVTPGRPETGPTYSCGGTPAEPDEVEIVSIKHSGKPVTLSDEEEEALWEMAIGRAGDDLAEEFANEADWRMQEARDRRLMEQWESGA